MNCKTHKKRKTGVESTHNNWYTRVVFTLAREGIGSRWPRILKTWPDAGLTRLASEVATTEKDALDSIEFSGQRASDRSGSGLFRLRLRPGLFSSLTKSILYTVGAALREFFFITPSRYLAHFSPRELVFQDEKGSRISVGLNCGSIRTAFSVVTEALRSRERRGAFFIAHPAVTP